ncbi:hypothetical protein NHX12_021208 [Muraenolepis orangiensis]|uniref:Uncharacterized protein n=1 Tax=Muraenolepis orangiensis TaxID=630683 RepID=A0A9Q0ESM7_9TELE|nr:hypothetical protein NHX12_021208 [Muraenolepis orangiensis]
MLEDTQVALMDLEKVSFYFRQFEGEPLVAIYMSCSVIGRGEDGEGGACVMETSEVVLGGPLRGRWVSGTQREDGVG